MMREATSKSAGYTLIELLIAMALFSVMLLFMIFGFLQTVRLYRGGLGARDTQSNARYGINELIRDARAADTMVIAGDINGSTPTSGDYFTSVCLNMDSRTSRYYVDETDPRSRKLMRKEHKPTALELPVPNVCDPAQDLSGPPEILSSDSVDMIFLELTKIDSGVNKPQALRINMKMATSTAGTSRDQDKCRAGGGNEYCNITELVGTATLRAEEDTP